MPATSRLGAAEDGLFTIIGARPALAAVPLDRAHPGNELRREHIWIGEAVSASQEWETTGIGSEQKMESLTISIWIRATDVDYQTSRNRALVLAGEVEAAVRADFKLSNQVWHGQVNTITKAATEVTDEGWMVALRVEVEARSFLA
jgi:hypothetical protein